MTTDASMSDAPNVYGGILRCETCRRMETVGDAGLRVTAVGWPKCCGYTMHWWTQRQMESGEMSRANGRMK